MDISELLKGKVNTDDEAALIRYLGRLPAVELNGLLERIDAAELLGSVDNRLIGPDHYDELVELLTRTRAGELSLPATASLLYGLQSGRTAKRDEHAIRDLLLRWKGTELTRLKNLIGDRTDRHDLEGLVYYDVDDEQIRAEILEHFRAEAPDLDGELKVLCDIDDTVLCALHDKRFPRGVIYPGVLALLEALDQGPRDEPFSTGDLTFVTARPADAFGVIETHSRDALRKAGIVDLDLMGGTLWALLTKEAMADRKLHNIEHYRQMFPEYGAMFIGDSGQGDPIVGERIHDEFGDISAVLIHDVVGTPEPERAAREAKGVSYFDSYVGAARIAYGRGLISAGGLRAVIKESRELMESIEWTADEQREQAWSLLTRDISAAEAVLSES